MATLGPPEAHDLASPEAIAAYWDRVQRAAVDGALTPTGATLLLWFAVGGLEAVSPAPLPTVQALLAAGADPNEPSPVDQSIGSTPLDAAAYGADGDLAAAQCRALVAAGVDVGAREDDISGGPLSFARTGPAALALLECGADATGYSPYEDSTLWSPASMRDPAVCKAMLTAGADVDAGVHPLYSAQSLGVVLALLGAGTNVSSLDGAGLSVLACPAALQDEEACAVLLAAGADPNGCHGQPLGRAATVGVVRTLLAAGAHPCPVAPAGKYAFTYQPLLSPAALSDPEACALLIAAGASVNARGVLDESPLCLAESPAVVALLLDEGADATIETTHGMSALMSPCASLDADTCKRLLAGGSRVTVDALYGLESVEVGSICNRITRAPSCPCRG
jgi:ankyrin repeat protein